jgi:hypothetical protein
VTTSLRRSMPRPPDLSKAWVGLYSAEQRCVHIEQLGEFVEKEVRQILNGRHPGYRLVVVSWSERATRNEIAKWQQARDHGEI